MTYKEFKTATKDEIYDVYIEEFENWAKNELDDLGWRDDGELIDNWDDFICDRIRYVSNALFDGDVFYGSLFDFVRGAWKEFTKQVFNNDKSWKQFLDWLAYEDIVPSEFDDED